MKTASRTRWARFLPTLLCLGLAACGSSRVEEERAPSPDFGVAAAPRGGPAVIRGTTLDASSGRPLSGVHLQGPGGSQAVSDGEGRFELRGLPLGAQGELLASTDDGRSGRNLLRPLQSGPLEVVVFVR